MESSCLGRSFKTPSMARIFWICWILGCATAPDVACAQNAPEVALSLLSEAEVVRLARERAPRSAVARATEELAEARQRTAAPLRNPTLSWSREAIATGPTGSEDIVSATIPIDLVRPRAARSLVASESAWSRAEAALARADAVLEAVLAYNAVALAERRVELLVRVVTDLDEAARVLQRRAEAGAISGYESTRLALASELGRSRLAEARGQLVSVQTRLAMLLGMRPDSIRVSTTIALMTLDDAATLARRSAATQEAVRQARASHQLAADAEESADWAWLPDLEVAGGMKHVTDQGGGYGYVLGVAVSVPLFDHGQQLRAEAKARRTLYSAREQALTRNIDVEVQSALAMFRSARQELERFETRTSGQVEALLKAAQSGYREGERTVVELLDAERAQSEVLEQQLGLLGSAKRAETRLRAAAGAFQ